MNLLVPFLYILKLLGFFRHMCCQVCQIHIFLDTVNIITFSSDYSSVFDDSVCVSME